MMSVRRLNAPVRLRMTVKNRVERPIIMASVPSMENRSFHKLIYFIPQKSEGKKQLINF